MEGRRKVDTTKHERLCRPHKGSNGKSSSYPTYAVHVWPWILCNKNESNREKSWKNVLQMQDAPLRLNHLVLTTQVNDTIEDSRQHSSKRRGDTTCQDVYNMEPSRRVNAQWNALGQPSGPARRSLKTFLGTIARDPQKLSYHHKDWRKISNTCEDDVFNFAQ
ncbi:hypothetical protein Taro_000308 [Colocasia esculenta]|uniref:Uncharacterized protein n=1 Tax=Colocasia esculenta TaxID=4460 RepID=A0A843T7J2_COLES|nr:hypothetical protein [Colocasia esculenta]